MVNFNATYTCQEAAGGDPDYRFVGKDQQTDTVTIRCQESGAWEEFPTSCKGEINYNFIRSTLWAGEYALKVG